NNFMQWVGLSLYRHQLVDPDSEIKTYRGEISQYPVTFDVSFYSADDLLGNIVTVNLDDDIDWDNHIQTTMQQADMVEPELDFKTAVALMAYTYPHEAATQTTSYQSVSEIKRLFEDPDNAQLLQLDVSQQSAKG